MVLFQEFQDSFDFCEIVLLFAFSRKKVKAKPLRNLALHFRTTLRNYAIMQLTGL